MLIAQVGAAVVHVDFHSNTKGIDGVFAPHDSRDLFFDKIVAIYVCALCIVGAFD